MTQLLTVMAVLGGVLALGVVVVMVLVVLSGAASWEGPPPGDCP